MRNDFNSVKSVLKQYPNYDDFKVLKNAIYKIKRGPSIDYSFDVKTGQVNLDNLDKLNADYERFIYNQNNSIYRSRINIFDLAICNKFDYFVTLTFDTSVRDNIELCTDLMTKFNDNMKHQFPDYKYLMVWEYHKDKKSIHFHGLISGIDDSLLVAATNPKNNKLLKTKSGLQIYNLSVFKNGFSTVTKIVNSEYASKYITKYITKQTEITNQRFSKKRYWSSRNLNKPSKKSYTINETKLIIEKLDSIKPFETEFSFIYSKLNKGVI